MLTVGLCLSLIPRYGMAGAALAVTVARCVATAMGTFEIWRIHGLHPFSRSLWKLALAALVAALLGCFCKHQVQVATHSLVTLTAAVGLAFFGYLASLRVFRFSLQSYKSKIRIFTIADSCIAEQGIFGGGGPNVA